MAKSNYENIFYKDYEDLVNQLKKAKEENNFLLLRASIVTF